MKNELIPIKNDLEGNFNKLGDVIMKIDGADQRQSYRSLLEYLKLDNHPEGGSCLLGMLRAPAAQKNHHAFEGGLCYHLLEMWDLWCHLELKILKGGKFGNSVLNDDRVARAILNHDIEKADRKFEYLGCPWSVQYRMDLPYRQVLSVEDLYSLNLLNKFNIKMDEIQLNALFWAHGGFSKTQNKAATVLAKMVYLLDEMSGNVISKIETGNLLGLHE